MGTGYRPEKNFWVPIGTGYRPEKILWRYNENGDGSDALVDLFTKFLPEHVHLEKEDPYAIQPNFDVDMNLLGFYETRRVKDIIK